MVFFSRESFRSSTPESVLMVRSSQSNSELELIGSSTQKNFVFLDEPSSFCPLYQSVHQTFIPQNLPALINQGRVFVPFKHVPVCNQKSVTKNMFLVHHENAFFMIWWNMAVFIAFLDN